MVFDAPLILCATVVLLTVGIYAVVRRQFSVQLTCRDKIISIKEAEIADYRSIMSRIETAEKRLDRMARP